MKNYRLAPFAFVTDAPTDVYIIFIYFVSFTTEKKTLQSCLIKDAEQRRNDFKHATTLKDHRRSLGPFVTRPKLHVICLLINVVL